MFQPYLRILKLKIFVKYSKNWSFFLKKYCSFNDNSNFCKNWVPCNKGESESLKRIQRRMAAREIKSVIVKKYKPVKAEINIEQKENIMNRDCTAASINQKWCTDITYIHTENDGCTYQAFSWRFVFEKNNQLGIWQNHGYTACTQGIEECSPECKAYRGNNYSVGFGKSVYEQSFWIGSGWIENPPFLQ